MKRMWSKEELDSLEIVATNIDSESAAGGQVLTADGSGGAQWEAPTETTHLYLYTGDMGERLTINGKQTYIGFMFSFYSSDPDISTRTQVINLLYAARTLSNRYQPLTQPITPAYSTQYVRFVGKIDMQSAAPTGIYFNVYDLVDGLFTITNTHFTSALVMYTLNKQQIF